MTGIQIQVVPTLKLSPAYLRQLIDRKLLLAVVANKTDYKTLRKLSENLRQVHATVIGAVIIDSAPKQKGKA